MKPALRFRTPINLVRGLGSAKHGTHHWWLQRLTAIALVPLSLWLVASLVSLVGADYQNVVIWVGSPVVTVLLICLLATLFHHAQLGLQVILEDYVHTEWLKITSIVLMKFTAFVLGLASVLAVLKVSLGG